MASFTITKLSWLHRTEPEAWRRLARIVLPHDWLTFRLTGRLVTDRGDAEGDLLVVGREAQVGRDAEIDGHFEGIAAGFQQVPPR